MDIEKFINEDLGINIRSFIKDDIVYLNAEDVCRGLGFVQVHEERVTTSGYKPYESVRWDRVNKYLEDYKNILFKINKFIDNSILPEKMDKDTYIPEQVFYFLAIKAKNEKAQEFQIWIVNDVLPSIRKRGYYREVHQDIRDLTKFLYKRFASTVMRMVNFCNKNENISLNATKELAKITKLTQIDTCDIPKGQRDFVTTEQLLKLACIESEVMYLISIGITNKMKFEEIIKNMNEMCERFKNNDFSFNKFYKDLNTSGIKLLNGIGLVSKNNDNITFDIFKENEDEIEKSFTLKLIK